MSNASPGRIVQVALGQLDADRINARRDADPDSGNRVAEGDVLPAIVVRAWPGDLINAQVFLDGGDTLWVTSRAEGDTPGSWAWPSVTRTDPGTTASTDLVRVGGDS